MLAAFGLHPDSPVEFLSDGWRNRSWRVDHPTGDVVVRHVCDIGADQVRHRHQATDAMAAFGLPVPQAVSTVRGSRLFDDPAGLFEASRWIDGEHLAGPTLSQQQCASLGALLARIHTTLNDVMPTDFGPVERGGGSAGDATPEPSPAQLGQDIAAIETLRRGLGCDHEIVARLRHWHTLLEHSAPLEAADRPARLTGWVHGDFQPLNLLWSAGHIVAVLDWDHLGLRTLADEVARSALVLFGPDLYRIAAFTAGYRSTHPLDDEDLTRAVHLLWWRRLDDLCRYLGSTDGCPGARSDRLVGAIAGMLDWWCAHHGTIMRLAWGDAPPTCNP